MELGIIGNCQYSALIDPYGDVRWLCWPRLDSSFIFGGLLDETHGGHFRISPPSTEGAKGQQSYIPNTNILSTRFETKQGAFELIDFAPRFHQYERYYKPKMLIRMVKPLSGKPLCRVSIDARGDYGKQKASRRLESNHIQFHGLGAEVRLTSNAPLSYIDENKAFVVDQPFYFVLTYGIPLEENLPYTCEHFFEKTKTYWETWVKHSYLPQYYQKEVIRSALVLKLHQFEDTGAIIAATTTSIPEANQTVRNWDYRFCWLRDALFSLSALQRLTQFEELEKFILYLHNLVEDSRLSDCDLQPVYGISGDKVLTEHILDHLAGYRNHRPVRIGNQAYQHKQYDVYGEMLLAISPLFLDERFIGRRQVLPLDVIQHLLGRIEKVIDSKDAGLWEFRGKAQLHTFSCLMHWAGAKIGERISRNLDEQTWRIAHKLKLQARNLINTRCWNPDVGSFTQAADSRNLDASLLMLVNMGFLSHSDPRALQLVNAIRLNLSHTNGFLHRYTAEDDFGETHNAFLICSFWLVEALAHLGQKEEARQLFERLLACSNHLGLYSEDVDPNTNELWGNFPQTYSHVGLINAAFSLSPHNGHLNLSEDFERD